MRYKINDIVPVEDFILVQLNKPHQVVSESVSLSEEGKAKAKEAYDRNEMYEASDEDKVVENVKVNAKFRTGTVLRLPEYPSDFRGIRYAEGQVVIFEDGHQIPLDILTNKVGDNKCPVLLRGLHIRGIVK